jgi:hypothetical protein
MTLDDWSDCPSCGFPALYSKFVEFVGSHAHCAMCEHDLTLSDIRCTKKPPKDWMEMPKPGEQRIHEE